MPKRPPRRSSALPEAPMAVRRLLVSSAVSALILVGVGDATARAGPQQFRVHRFTIELSPQAVVPAPNGAGDSFGTFSATFVPYRRELQLRFNLTYERLTGLATSAHVHIGKRGEAGPVLIHLCRPGRGQCGYRYSWTSAFSAKLLERARIEGAYVDVHTTHNPHGELRGQMTPAMLGGRR